MEVELSKAPYYDTPAAEVAEEVVEHIAAIMMLCGGIESMAAERFDSGYGSRLHVTIAPFTGAPKEIVDQGVIIKDALAQILSIANINRIVTKPSEADLNGIRKRWRRAVSDAKSVNAGSGQNFQGNKPGEGSAEG